MIQDFIEDIREMWAYGARLLAFLLFCCMSLGLIMMGFPVVLVLGILLVNHPIPTISVAVVVWGIFWMLIIREAR